MKNILFVFMLLAFVTSCRKKDDLPISPTMKLLQHDWTYISVRIYFPNGSNYKLLNNYLTFRKDGKAINTIYGLTGTPIYDTSIYKLMDNNTDLLFYSIIRGVRSVDPEPATIETLNDTLLVYYFKDNNGFIESIDSLKR